MIGRWIPTSVSWHWASWCWGPGVMYGRGRLDHVTLSSIGLSSGWKVTGRAPTRSFGPVTLIFGTLPQ